jgi:hypothetical protein
MRSPFVTALFHPLNIGMFALSVFAGLVAAWWLFPLGLFLWLTMVVTASRDASLQFNYQMQSRDPLAQRFQQYFDRIQRAQLRVFNALSSAPSSKKRVLEPIRTEVDALTAQVYALCQRMTTLENYRVVTESQRDLAGDLSRIDEALKRTQDPGIRQEYESSRQSIQERMDRQYTVTVLLDRVEAQLLGLANELDGLVTEVIRLQALAPDDAAPQISGVVANLREQSAQFRDFEREVAQV